MSIPLDRLYHYIESVARDIHGDNVLIYRFTPHGSKKFTDLRFTKDYSWLEVRTNPQVICYDQEPLNYDYYQDIDYEQERVPSSQGISILDYFKMDGVAYPQQNLRGAQYNGMFNIYDQAVLLHSELRSTNVDKYSQDQYIPAYYWSHALLALDWFRYAQYNPELKQKNSVKPFLIYNRAWAGTREYRLKFADILIDLDLISHCQISCNANDPETGTHYHNHQFKNFNFRPKHRLEDYYNSNSSGSWMSADFDSADYAGTDIEIVLETLFDDDRLHLTEKSLRPIACGQPFILAATVGSLEYLRNYGFKTFNSVINESYDKISDPVQRLSAIAQCMKDLISCSTAEYQSKLKHMQDIAKYNQRWFFNKDFFNLITSELNDNLKTALESVHQTNTGQRCLDLRKQLCQYPNIKRSMIQSDSIRSRADIVEYLKILRSYYNKHTNK